MKQQPRIIGRLEQVGRFIKTSIQRNNFLPFFPMGLLGRLAVVTFATLTVTFFLFQKKLLPLPISKIVSKLFFLPTFPFTALLRLGNYWTKIDDTLILGCAPFGFLGHPDMLYKIGVRGAINMCYEYPGPVSHYERVGIKQLYLPTCDHFEPSLENMNDAVAFIKYHKNRGEKVYLHCKAGHGRAASIALCWLIDQNKDKHPKVRILFLLIFYYCCVVYLFLSDHFIIIHFF